HGPSRSLHSLPTRRSSDLERVNYIIDKTNYYGPRGNDVHGLIFVSRVTEGRELAFKLADKGINTQFVSAEDTVEAREKAVHRLTDRKSTRLNSSHVSI